MSKKNKSFSHHNQPEQMSQPQSAHPMEREPENAVKKEQVPVPDIDSQLKNLTEESLHWKDLALRSQAEMENLRKRTKIDIDNAVRYANKDFAKDLLEVADCLNSALKCANDAPQKEGDVFLKNLVAGLEMTRKQLETVFKKHGIEKMETVDHIFDPEFHKVIQEIENTGKPSGTIVQELQAGYTIGGQRILREAMVIVSK